MSAAFCESKPRVLLVNHRAEVGNFILTMLKCCGYEAVRCSNVKQCLELVPLFDPDIILLDINFRERITLEIIADLREFSMIPVVVLGRDYNLREEALAAGASDFLSKPFIQDELTSIMKHVLLSG